ncbi:MAG: hypothetical protein GEV09_28580, partial [Pseudonocardiaceae bacterium]|nr:hypothetical protein [Pseudonocardiaceae bacterium]
HELVEVRAGLLGLALQDALAGAGREAAGQADHAVRMALEQLEVDARLAAVQALEEAGAVADVLIAGDSEVDLSQTVQRLGERGFRHVLAEGGPSFNGALATAGLLDELCLTVAPRLVSGSAKRIVTGPTLVPPSELSLHTACEEDGYLFLRYRFPGR